MSEDDRATAIGNNRYSFQILDVLFIQKAS